MLPETLSVIQVGASVLTVAVQPAVTVTVKLPLPPAAATLAEVADSEYVQVVEPVIVKGCR